MRHLRVTKYNPINRNEHGHYVVDEWTSVSDIGETFLDIPLTVDEYFRIESLYVDAVLEIMSCNGIEKLKVRDLENRWNRWNSRMTKKSNKKMERFLERNPARDRIININRKLEKLSKKINNNQYLARSQISDVIRLNLREDTWCRLEYEDKMFVHFGYDYYMYIGSDKVCNKSIDTIRESGLFVEDFKSPYLKL